MFEMDKKAPKNTRNYYNVINKSLKAITYPIQISYNPKTCKKEVNSFYIKWGSLTESVNQGKYHDFAIVCGKKSGITVLDLDVKTGEICKEQLNVFDNFKKLLNIDIMDFAKKCLKVRTPSGGLHLIFKYDERFKTGTDCFGIKGFDIRNDRSIIYAGTKYKLLYENGETIKISKPSNKLYEILDNFKKNLNSNICMGPNINTLENKILSKVKNDIKDSSIILKGEKLNENKNINLSSNEKYKKFDELLDLTKESNLWDSYESWYKIGQVLKNEFENEDDEIGWLLFDKYSKISKTKYNSYNNFKSWNSWKKTKSTIASIIKYVKEVNLKGYENWKNKYNKKEVQKKIINKKLINKFDLEDNYNFTTLNHYLDENIFSSEDQLIDFLDENLYKVLVKVDDYMIVKKPYDEFNNIHSIELYNKKWRVETIGKYYKEGKNGDILVKDPLIKILEDYPNLISRFQRLNVDFIKDGEEIKKDEFYISEDYKAKKLDLTDDDIKLCDEFWNMVLEVHANGDEKMLDIIKKWFAFMVNNPNKKSGKCFIFVGSQGCGKSTLIDFFAEFIFGNKICMFLKGFKELLADKNGHLSGKKFVNLNEVQSKKGDYFTNFNDLKTLISDDKIQIRGLYQKTKMEKSNMELVITTNNPNCCPIEENDRKYIICNVSNKYMQKDKDFWIPFRKKFFNQDFGDKLYTYLIKMNLTYEEWRSIDFNEYNTELKNNLRELNKTSTELFFEDLNEMINLYGTLNEKGTKNNDLYYVDNKGDNINYEFKLVKDKIRIKSTSLYTGYVCYCHNNGEKASAQKYFNLDIINKLNKRKIKSDGIYYWEF